MVSAFASSTSSSSSSNGDDQQDRQPNQNANHHKNANQNRRQKAILENLTAVETELQEVIERHRPGVVGYVTREWGFTAPGGLGPPLGGKFRPWERKLEQAHNFFWPIEAYRAMDATRPFGLPDPEEVKDLPPEGEQLYGNTPLYDFLESPPSEIVTLEPSDYEDYRAAAKLLLLLGTLSHLYGNAAPDRKAVALPLWIEDPLRDVAHRLRVEPTLSGHFLVQENWIWKSSQVALLSSAAKLQGTTTTVQKKKQHPRRMSRTSSKQCDRVILHMLLQETICQDRRYRLTIYSDCFVGNQLVDLLMDHGYAESRHDAVRLGRSLNDQFQVFQHVTNDHLLMDKHLFYRFRRKWQKTQADSIAVKTEGALVSQELNLTPENDGTNGNDDNEEEEERTRRSRLLRPSDLLRRRTSDQSCNGDLDRTSSHSSAPSVCSSNDLYFAIAECSLTTPSTAQLPSIPIVLSPLQDTTTTTTTTLQETMQIIAIMGLVPIKDRRFCLRVYKDCFVASQLVDVLMKHECASRRKDAVQLALEINKEFKLFHHVVDIHPLKDDYLFFRFTKVFQTMMEKMSGSQVVSTTGIGGAPRDMMFGHRNANSARSIKSSISSVALFLDQDLNPQKNAIAGRNRAGELTLVGSSDSSYEALMGMEEEFRFDNIAMLYPAFGNNHERVNQLIPACMGHALAGLPFLVLDIITAMRNVLEVELRGSGNEKQDDDMSSVDSYKSRRLYDLLYKAAFSVSRCKEAFQQMSTDPSKRTFNSKYVSIKQTQPLSNGVPVRRTKGGTPQPSKGTTGTQFPYFHLLDWLLGRFQFDEPATTAGSCGSKKGLVAQIAAVDDTFPPPQREYIRSLSKLNQSSTLRGFMEALSPPNELLTAYNHLMECYGGESGVLQAHCRKLYSYIHNNVQSSTSGTNHLKSSSGKHATVETPAGCPMSNAMDNHNFATTMFQHMRKAATDRWKLRLPPLMTEVGKVIYSTSESGGFTTVALDLTDSGLLYEYGDVVKVLLPNDEKTTLAWIRSLTPDQIRFFKLEDMKKIHKNTCNGWGWSELWEALGWCRFERNGGKGVSLDLLSHYIEQGQIRDDERKTRWVNCPLDLSGQGEDRIFGCPPPISLDNIASLEPVSPRVYSVSGVESERVFLLVSKPQDGGRHHGYEGMSNPRIERVHCSFSPATFFLVPPREVNLVCIASGTGISPFVGLVDVIGSREGSYTIIHQCKSSDLFLANSQCWLDFTAINPGAVILGYISGDRSRRNCPMRYVVRNGAFEETTVLRRRNACAYYFECELFQSSIQETYKPDGLNLAYCCGGVKSAIEPLVKLSKEENMSFEITCETYGVSSAALSRDSNASQIGGTIVNMDHVSPIHPGGDQILQQVTDLAGESLASTGDGDKTTATAAANTESKTPDLSIAFYELHPHAYNLLRCLRSPLDADSEAFAAFLERQAMSKSVMTSMATKYAQVALASPDDSKIVKIATELQSTAIREQLNAGDTQGAQKSAAYLEALLDYVPNEDRNNNERWMKSLTDVRGTFNEG